MILCFTAASPEPRMAETLFEQLESTLRAKGPATAIDRLCASLQEAKDYPALFYALLMKKRHELGVSPVPTAPSHELPADLHAPYEEGIRQAARQVGGLLLRDGQIGQAWAYYRMIDEPGPVREALEKYRPGPDDDLQPVIHVALYENVHPTRGFDWVIERYGICSAITTLSGQELAQSDDVKRYCVAALVRALHQELRGRLAAEIEAREGAPPPGADAPLATAGILPGWLTRGWLFEEDSYHIDTSHLSSVVQMSHHLAPCLEMTLARELCDYGRRLTGHFSNQSDPPFEDLYPAHDRYLAILQGEDVEENLGYFRAQADKADPEEVGTYPAEVLVNLLLRLNREPEALAVARRYLARADGRRLTCPSVPELCQQLGDYGALAEVARAQGDPVHFLAGLLAAQRDTRTKATAL
jgi:hypothetical protein